MESSSEDQVHEAYDPFAEETLREDADPGEDVEKILTAVPVRRPKRDEFFRVHPEFIADKKIIERDSGMDRETYLVVPECRNLVAGEIRKVRLFTCVNKFNTVFLWPAKLPREDSNVGRAWQETALRVADEAQKLWVRLVGNKNLGAYEMYRARGDLGEPQWPDKSFRELQEIAFRDNLIDRTDHPVIKELNGEL